MYLEATSATAAATATTTVASQQDLVMQFVAVLQLIKSLFCSYAFGFTICSGIYCECIPGNTVREMLMLLLANVANNRCFNISTSREFILNCL